MAITFLRLTNFRNFPVAELVPCRQGLNILYGANGSGKTSLLEAIHYTGLGRSFRNGVASQLIRHQTNKFVIFAHIGSEWERDVSIGLERELNGASRLRLAEKEAVSIMELATFLPIRLINAHSHCLLESGPVFRRKFLDWGLFYQFENFFPCWRHFERVLRQRNSLLRNRRSKQELSGWTVELVKYALVLDDLRRQYLRLFMPFFTHAVQVLLGMPGLDVHYYPGWDESEDYSLLLSRHYQDEYRLGRTAWGPHRADLVVTANTIPAKHFLSRGQQKLLVCAMLIAQGMLLAQHANKEVIYLVDDLPSELDSRGRQTLMSLLAQQSAQVFITAIEREAMNNFLYGQNDVLTKVFHVEHGCVTEC